MQFVSFLDFCFLISRNVTTWNQLAMDFHLNSESFRTRLTEILSYGRSVRLQGLFASNLGISSQHFWCKISVTEGCVKTDAFENERSVVPVYTTKQDAKRQDTLR